MEKLFPYKQRGGTTGGEIAAGLCMGLLSVCGIFMNLQLLAQYQISGPAVTVTAAELAANGEAFAQMYFVSMLVSFAGSLLIGLAAHLPLVQVSSLGLSAVLVSLVGVGTGLTYYNLLFLCFVSSVIYAAILAIPGGYGFLVGTLPAGVRKALPAAAGLLLAGVAAQLSGVFPVKASSIPVYGAGSVLEASEANVALSGFVSFDNYSYLTDKYHPTMLVCAVSVLVAIVIYLLRRRSNRPCLTALLGGTVVFLLGSVLLTCVNWKNMTMSFDSMWARLWTVGSEDSMQLHLSTVLKNLSIGAVFTQGMDFTAYTEAGGNVIRLFATGILTNLLLNLYDADTTLTVVAAESSVAETSHRLPLLCNAAINVVAPIVGAGPVAIGKESVAGARDHAKSGLASVVAAIVMLVSAFVWAVPFFLATITSYDVTFNMYGHYGTVLQYMTECSFSVADIVMVLVGLGMAIHSAGLEWSDLNQSVPFVATVAGTLLTSNLAVGAAAGLVAFVLVNLSKAPVVYDFEEYEEEEESEAEDEGAAEAAADDAEAETGDGGEEDIILPEKEPGLLEKVGVKTLILAAICLMLLILTVL